VHYIHNMINITSKTKNTVRLFDSGRQETNVDRQSNTENMYTVTLRFCSVNIIVLNNFFSSMTDSVDFDGHNLVPSVLHLSHGFQCS